MAELGTTALFNDASLQAYHKLEDTSDSKNSNTLTNNNSVTFTSAKYGNGANLGSSNTNKTLSVASNLGLGSGAYSIVLWCKRLAEPATNASDFLAGVKTTTVGLHIQYGDNAGQKFLAFDRVRLGVADDQASINITALGTSAFHHIALTYDGSTIRGYLDGALLGSAAASGTGSGGSNIAYIGADQGGSGPSSALLDDVGWFTKALSLAEIQTLAFDGIPNKINAIQQAVNRASTY